MLRSASFFQRRHRVVYGRLGLPSGPSALGGPPPRGVEWAGAWVRRRGPVAEGSSGRGAGSGRLPSGGPVPRAPAPAGGESRSAVGPREPARWGSERGRRAASCRLHASRRAFDQDARAAGRLCPRRRRPSGRRRPSWAFAEPARVPAPTSHRREAESGCVDPLCLASCAHRASCSLLLKDRSSTPWVRAPTQVPAPTSPALGAPSALPEKF